MQLPEELVGVNESNDIFVILKELVKLCKKPYKKPNTKNVSKTFMKYFFSSISY